MAFGGVFHPVFRPVFDQIGAVVAPGMTNFLTAAYTGVRNDFPGWVGYQITLIDSINVVALGRSISGSITQDHVVSISRASDQARVATATITPSSPVAANGYAYELVSVSLSSGATYRIASLEFSGGDLWMNVGSLSSHTGVATIDYGVYLYGSGEGYPASSWGAADEGFGPPTFFY